eukprot:NODE_11752_length_1266_cov_20.450395.p5 GENE.NODE_11752_length_1266_cov_20.450395~~NODE_11752_length_1266_cov_20.450395.p5  ORF type:complete len:59 (-),score=8.18 NODE_11752_length_1266_cov_20.450395:467-643(-)
MPEGWIPTPRPPGVYLGKAFGASAHLDGDDILDSARRALQSYDRWYSDASGGTNTSKP